MKRLFILLALTGLLGTGLAAQTTLSSSFDKFSLGMGLDQLKTALKNNSYFLYNGEPDVSLLSRPNTNLIDVPGLSYFSRGVFQVVDGRLYSMTFELNRDQLDYFALFTALSKKYGPPTALDPSSARWESAQVRLSLEKPLTVKYIDMVVFQKGQASSRAEQALQALAREKFLEAF